MAKKAKPLCPTCDSKRCFVRRFTTDQWKNLAGRVKETIVYRKGQVIFNEGEAVKGIFFIYTGKVKLYSTGAKQKKQIVRLAGDGDIFGHRGFGKKMEYPVSAAAIEDTVACFIETKEFLEILNHNPQLPIQLLMFYSDELKRAEYKLRSLSQMNVKQKLAEALLTVRSIYGTEEQNGIQVLNVELTRQEIAEIIGTSPEEVIRTLSQMNKEESIVLDGKKIGIKDEKQLFELVKEFKNVLLP